MKIFLHMRSFYRVVIIITTFMNLHLDNIGLGITIIVSWKFTFPISLEKKV